MKYLKKAIPVDAWQIDTLELENQGAYPDWVADALANKSIEHVRISNQVPVHCVRIVTLEGTMTAYDGDYLIKGPKGEYWFNKKNIFEEMYEEYNENPIHWQGGEIQNIRVVDNPDGSANIIMDMDDDMKNFFASEGIKRVLRDAVEALAEKYESEKQ
jgi:hypothetical protein